MRKRAATYGKPLKNALKGMMDESPLISSRAMDRARHICNAALSRTTGAPFHACGRPDRYPDCADILAIALMASGIHCAVKDGVQRNRAAGFQAFAGGRFQSSPDALSIRPRRARI